MSVVFAFAAAFCNALNVVTQHVASTAAPAHTKGWRLGLYLVRRPLWLLGVAADVAAFGFQAVALYEGRLSVVQTILVTELVFSLVIGRVWLRRPVRAAAWVSASVVSLGLAIFLLVSEPEGGSRQPTPGLWLPALLMVSAAVVVLTVLADHGSPVRRAALYGSAAAIAWASMATLLKSATDVLAGGGVGSLLANGAVYGVIVAAAVGIVLTQAALHHGPLAVSQPLMVTVDPFVSILLGVWLYGEEFVDDAVRVVFAAVGFAMIVVGVVFLTRAAPSFEAHPSPAGSGVAT
jgi:drug/metabolite transporter (DMT)-like permease